MDKIGLRIERCGDSAYIAKRYLFQKIRRCHDALLYLRVARRSILVEHTFGELAERQSFQRGTQSSPRDVQSLLHRTDGNVEKEREILVGEIARVLEQDHGAICVGQPNDGLQQQATQLPCQQVLFIRIDRGQLDIIERNNGRLRPAEDPMTFGPHDRPKPAAECRGFYELASMEPGVEERRLNGVFGGSSLAQNRERVSKRGVLKTPDQLAERIPGGPDDSRSTAVATSVRRPSGQTDMLTH